MEAVAAFVYASGGLVRLDELMGLFETHPEVLAQVYEEAAPVRAMKKVVGRIGEMHGLSWLDMDPQSGEPTSMIAHTMTTKQAQGDVFRDKILWIPRCLDAVERHVRALPGTRLKIGAIVDFYREFPLESAFMKRRCKGFLDFLQRYDPEQRRLGRDSNGVFCAPSSHALAANSKPDQLSCCASIIDRANGCPTESESDDDEYSASYRNFERVIEREVAKSYEAGRKFGDPIHVEASSEDEAAANESVWSQWSANVSILPSPNFLEDPYRTENDLFSVATALSAQVEVGTVCAVQSAFNGPNLQPVSCFASRNLKDSSALQHADVPQSKLKRCGGKASVNVLSLVFNQNKWTPNVMLLALAQVNLVLNHFRASPVLHPLAFLFIAVERRRQTRRAKRIAEEADTVVRRSRPTPKAVAVTILCANADEEDFREGTSDVIVTYVETQARRVQRNYVELEAWTVEHAMNSIRLVSLILNQVRATPTPHPLAFLFIVHERCKRQRRLRRRARALAERAQQTRPFIFDICIPKVTLAALSVSSICEL